ncbi:MAG: alanine racemase, partial [Methylobacteriaceae bacterium]|nr:alanine racemase [Methylobacteriaceae bacterium]
RRLPLAGRVSMDLTTIDVTDAPDVAEGERVTLIGEAIGVDDLAARAGTNGYEILTRLGARYRRVLKG